jgi:hypothetical protein
VASRMLCGTSRVQKRFELVRVVLDRMV